jgi:HEAT repeat protein
MLFLDLKAKPDLRMKLKINFLLITACIFILSSCCDGKKLPLAHNDLFSSSASKRNQAALFLARCGEDASKSVPRLTELLYDDNVGVQSSAAYALRKIDTPEAREALEVATKKRKE